MMNKGAEKPEDRGANFNLHEAFFMNVHHYIWLECASYLATTSLVCDEETRVESLNDTKST